MNKVILMGRFTRDPEARYSSGTQPVAVVHFGIAVNRRFKREGEQEADFFNCTAFGKMGEFINKYFKKGQQILITGNIRNNTYTDKNGQKKTSTEIIIKEAHFTGSKKDNEQNTENTDTSKNTAEADDFYSAAENIDDDDLPF